MTSFRRYGAHSAKRNTHPTSAVTSPICNSRNNITLCLYTFYTINVSEQGVHWSRQELTPCEIVGTTSDVLIGRSHSLAAKERVGVWLWSWHMCAVHSLTSSLITHTYTHTHFLDPSVQQLMKGGVQGVVCHTGWLQMAPETVMRQFWMNLDSALHVKRLNDTIFLFPL